MKDRFDLEVEILKLHPFRGQLEDLARRVANEDMDPDDVASALLGLAVLVDMQCDSLYDTMCQVLHIDEYAVDDNVRTVMNQLN